MADLRHAALSTYDAVVPLTLRDRCVLDHRRARGEWFNALYPSASAQENCDDKTKFNQLMSNAGLSDFIPTVFDDADALPLGKPIIIKRHRDAWGKFSRIAYQEINAPVVYDPSVEFLQEYVPGNIERSAHILMHRGNIIFGRGVRFKMPDSPHVKGIYTRQTRTEWDNGLVHRDLFAAALSVVGFTDGACCVDFRQVNGIPKIFEINPRLGGSLAWNIDDYLKAYVAAASNNVSSFDVAELMKTD